MESSDEWSSSHGDEETAAAEEVESLGIKCEGGAWEDDDGADKSECTSVDAEEEDDADDSWDDELQSFLEESPEFRAKVQYQVRVVALIPGFEAAGSKVSAFSKFYKLRFGKSLLENTGFSSAEILCRSMPHVIQRQALDMQGEVVLVESAKNMRIVAGIRSGLRRVVFQILKQHPKGVSARDFEDDWSQLIGRPLSVVLTELAYDTPNVECMVRDMADIANYRQIAGASSVFLSSEAEDPALTDGILLHFQKASEATAENSPTEFGDVLSSDLLQAKFRTIVLLAMHSGGIEINGLQKAYAELYTESLDSRLLGFSCIQDLVRNWRDIILLQESSVSQKVFLRASRKTCRILATLSSGLRLAVFSILLKCYPDGLEPASVLSQLHESHCQQIMASYGCAGVEGSEDRQDLALHAFCLVVNDMMDFIVFGCRDDGTLIIKLRNAGFPLIDFPQCNIPEDEFVKLLMEGGEDLKAIVGSSYKWRRLAVEARVGDEMETETVTSNEAVEHRIRLIMGSQQYFLSGLSLEEFVSAYKERSGDSLLVDQLKIVAPGLLRMVEGQLLLVENPKNLRIIQATKAGLRQALYWALLKNPGGVWSDLLDGWFSDFTGYSLATVLLRHGYYHERSPVDEFLEDMADICKAEEDGGIKFYVMAEECREDPAIADGRLLGMDTEYSPMGLCLEMERHAAAAAAAAAVDDELSPGLEIAGNGVEEYHPPKAYATPGLDETSFAG